MKWEGNRESDNVEDRRGSGGGFPIPGGRGIGIGTIVIALLGGWLLMVAQRHLPGWGHVVADLKTAIVLAEKNGVRGVAG